MGAAWTRWRKKLRVTIARWWAGPSLGRRGERAAEKFLREQGYRVLHRNYEILGGELDLVVLDGRTIVFVEVKTRATTDLGTPAEMVDDAKQRQLSRIAAAYLKRYHLQNHHARFDVIAVIWPPHQKRPQIRHLRNAFEATF